MESDLRRPSIHKYLNLKPERGLSDLLLSPDDPLDDYVWHINRLSLILGGATPAEPLEVLTPHNLRYVFDRLKQQYQYIVVDSPPIVPIVDSHILADIVDGVVLVVRAQQTRRELLHHALQNFEASRILGVVLNGVNLERSRYYYAYDYYESHYLAGHKGAKAL